MYNLENDIEVANLQKRIFYRIQFYNTASEFQQVGGRSTLYITSDGEIYLFNNGQYIQIAGSGGGGSGVDGKSAYEVAVENGFIGDETAWLESLIGEDGNGIASASYNPNTGVLTLNFENNTTFQTGDIRGEQGIQGTQGPAGPGVPTGGTIGQVLAKIDGTDYNTHFIDPPTGGLTQAQVLIRTLGA